MRAYILFLLAIQAVAQSELPCIIETLTGATSTFSGDGGPAVDAMLYNPSSLVFSPGGELLIADTGNHRIRLVDAAGTITTVIGTGFGEFNGDGAGPLETAIRAPRGLAFSPSGELYFADAGNARIRKVTAEGVVVTVAGTGAKGDAGDGGLPRTRA